jgi:hypothetical protein
MKAELRINNEDACRLASELTELTGESIEAAVATALRERFERELARQAMQDRIMDITRDIALRARQPASLDRPLIGAR